MVSRSEKKTGPLEEACWLLFASAILQNGAGESENPLGQGSSGFTKFQRIRGLGFKMRADSRAPKELEPAPDRCEGRSGGR